MSPHKSEGRGGGDVGFAEEQPAITMQTIVNPEAIDRRLRIHTLSIVPPGTVNYRVGCDGRIAIGRDTIFSLL
jgi:hypothetical protein